jgi:hypothetical protein
MGRKLPANSLSSIQQLLLFFHCLKNKEKKKASSEKLGLEFQRGKEKKQ